MRATRLILAMVATSGVTAGTAAAAPDYIAPLTDTLREQARLELVEQAKEAGFPPQAVDRRLAHSAFATSSDNTCPMIDVDVVNATDHTVWSIELNVKQNRGTEEHVDHIHLPYLPAQTVAHAQVQCMRGFQWQGQLQVGYTSKAPDTLSAALASLQRTKVDYLVQTGRVLPLGSAADRPLPSGLPRPHSAPRPPGDHGTLLVEALGFEDADVAKELVLGIANAGVGLDELSAEITEHPEGPIATAVGDGLTKMPAALRPALARALLASPVADRWKAQLVPMIDGPLCRGKRPDVVELWVQAQSETDFPAAELRARANARCKLIATDGPFLAAALDREPRRARAALDAVDGKLFDGTIAGFRAHPEAVPGLAAYLRDSTDAARFDHAATALTANTLPQAIAAVVKASPGPITDHKAAWVTANLDKVADAKAMVGAVTSALVEGQITAPAMHDVVRTVRAKVPSIAENTIADYAREHSSVYDVGQLDSSIDAGELLAFSTAELKDCGASLDALRGCAKTIAGYQGGALAKLNGKGLRGEFLNKLNELIRGVTDMQQLPELAGELRAAGLPTAVLTERACRAAADADDPEPQLAIVAKVDPAAPCIANVRSDTSWRKHKAIWLTVFGILGLVVPIPAGGIMLRRRFRKLQRDLPAVAADPSQGADKLTDRLGERSLGRGLRVGVAEAGRELVDTAAGTAAAILDDAVLDAAAATVGRAVRSGDAASLLVRRTRDAVYVVVLPVRHARPQIVERYLGATWPEHIASIQRAAGCSVLALILLCGPEAREASLLVGFAPAPGDPRPATDPEALLDARAARERGANRFHHVMTLSVTPSHEA